MTSLRAPISTLVVALTLLGCKPDDEPAEEQPPQPIAVEDGADRIARQLCASLYACECGGVDTAFASEAACVEQVRTNVQTMIDQTLTAGGTWNDDCAGQMVAAWTKWECLGPIAGRRLANYDRRACPVLEGNAFAGSGCDITPLGDDCDPSSVCVGGICIESQVPVPLGEVCQFDWQELPCVPEGYCAYQAESGTRICEPPRSAGDSCDDNYGCGAPNMMCKYETLICEVGPAAGEPCFDGFTCGPGLYCDGGKDFTCQERFEIGDGCSGNSVCPIDASCVGNICEANPPTICGQINLFSNF
jgi:hypothetical protein